MRDWRLRSPELLSGCEARSKVVEMGVDGRRPPPWVCDARAGCSDRVLGVLTGA